MNPRIEGLLEDLQNAVRMFNKSVCSYCDILLSLEEVEDESVEEKVNEIIKNMPPSGDLLDFLEQYNELPETDPDSRSEEESEIYDDIIDIP